MSAENALPEPFTVDVSAAELPELLAARLGYRPAPWARFRITVEPILTDEQKLARVKQDIAAGIEALDRDPEGPLAAVAALHALGRR